ncbi:tetratricopeptide repeat protein, partial [Candidatus Obscuribacterales bacterium]|nr:tetratricopeptide repeat protein [Candidatus Obscuribacterales bacterium]
MLKNEWRLFVFIANFFVLGLCCPLANAEGNFPNESNYLISIRKDCSVKSGQPFFWGATAPDGTIWMCFKDEIKFLNSIDLKAKEPSVKTHGTTGYPPCFLEGPRGSVAFVVGDKFLQVFDSKSKEKLFELEQDEDDWFIDPATSIFNEPNGFTIVTARCTVIRLSSNFQKLTKNRYPEKFGKAQLMCGVGRFSGGAMVTMVNDYMPDRFADLNKLSEDKKLEVLKKTPIGGYKDRYRIVCFKADGTISERMIESVLVSRNKAVPILQGQNGEVALFLSVDGWISIVDVNGDDKRLPIRANNTFWFSSAKIRQDSIIACSKNTATKKCFLVQVDATGLVSPVFLIPGAHSLELIKITNPSSLKPSVVLFGAGELTVLDLATGNSEASSFSEFDYSLPAGGTYAHQMFSVNPLSFIVLKQNEIVKYSIVNSSIFDKELSSLTATIDNEPRNGEALCERGTIFLQKGLFAQAIHDFEQAVKIDPKDSKRSDGLNESKKQYCAPFLREGQLNIERKNWKGAIISLEKASQILESELIRHRLGFAYQENKDYLAAIENYKKAMALDPQR